MEQWLVAPLVGGCIVTFGLFLLRTHVNSWSQEQADKSLDDHERNFCERRYRRRMQTTAVLIGIGAMLSVLDQLPLGKAWLTVYLALLLLSTLWIAFQALGDMAHTKFHSRASLARIRRKQRELQEELSGLRDQNR